MAHAIVLRAPGGVENLEWRESDVAAPGAGEVLLRQHAAGVNFIDIYHRTGLYPLPAYPHGLGMEAAGVVEAVGQGVTGFSRGDRVAYARGAPGAYAEWRIMPQESLVGLPDSVDFTTAAALLLKGLTAHYLLKSTYPVKPGDTVLVHAAAGGVGLLLCQWAKRLGATVIGTAGNAQKAALAQAHGCDYPILYMKENVSARVRELTGGQGVDVAYDSVGQATFMDSLNCLKPCGMMVSFGQSSGKVEPLDIDVLSQKGSLFLTRPTLMTHTADPARYRAMAAEVLDLVGQGAIKPRLDRTLPLRQAAEVHTLLETRQTQGSVVLGVD